MQKKRKTYNFYYAPAKLKKFQKIAYPLMTIYMIIYIVLLIASVVMIKKKRKKGEKIKSQLLLFVSYPSTRIGFIIPLMLISMIEYNQRKYRKWFVFDTLNMLQLFVICVVVAVILFVIIYQKHKTQKNKN